MGLFTKLFGSLLAFVYHCFDRIVIHGKVLFGAHAWRVYQPNYWLSA